MAGDQVTLLRILLRFPWHMLFLAGVLVTVGALALYSASEGSWSPWAGRHAVRGSVGVGIMVVLAFIDFRILRMWAYPLFIASVGVLVALLFIGSGNGVARWISIGGFTFQPSEPAKIALILALAKYFNDLQPDRVRNIVTYLPPLVMIAVPFILVVEQPDLGTALALALGGLTILFVAGMPWRYIGLALIGAGAAVPIMWAQLRDYQKARVMTFLNPDSDMLGAGYQITQS